MTAFIEPTEEERQLLAAMLRSQRAEIVVEAKDGLPGPHWTSAKGCADKGLLTLGSLRGGMGPLRSVLTVRYKLTPRGIAVGRASLD